MKTTKLPILRSLALAAMLAPAAPTGADVLSDWNDTTMKVIKATGVGGPATRPLALENPFGLVRTGL